MSTLANTVVKRGAQVFVSVAVMHTALDVLQAAWRRVHKADPTVKS